MGRKIGTVLSFATIFLEIFTALFLTPFIIRSFGQAEYGIYTLVISITSYLALLDLGVGHSVVRFMAKYRANQQMEEQRRFLGITTVYYAAIVCIVLIAGGVMVYVLPDAFAVGLNEAEVALAQKLLSITTVNVAITLGTSGFVHTVAAYENFIISKGVPILTTLLRVLVSVIALNMGVKSLGIVTCTAAINFLNRFIIMCVVLFKMKLKPTLRNVKFSQIKEITSYSGIILIQMIATQINNMANQILLGAFAASSAVILGIYGVGAQINQYFQSFGGAVNGVLMPGVVRLVEGGATPKDLQNEMARIGRINFMFIGFVWTVFLVFGKQFVILWAGGANQGAYGVTILMTLPIVFILSQSIGNQIMWAKNKHKVQAICKFTIVVLNVLLTISLMRWNPLLGASLGAFISLMLGDVIVMQCVFKKYIGIELKSYYRALFKGIIPSMGISLVIGMLIKTLNFSGWIGFLVNCMIMTAAYGLCMYKFGFNSYERKLIGNIRNKFLAKKNGGQ